MGYSPPAGNPSQSVCTSQFDHPGGVADTLFLQQPFGQPMSWAEKWISKSFASLIDSI